MYFFSEQERKQLLRGLLTQSREVGVADELRGWNWDQPPLASFYDCPLTLSEVANTFCSSGRDLYLRRVESQNSSLGSAAISGIALHKVMNHFVTAVKKVIYSVGVENYRELLQEIRKLTPMELIEYKNLLSKEDFSDLQRKAEIVYKFELDRVCGRIQEILVKQPYIGTDALVATTLPVVVEQKLDGSFLGLSPNLSTDAFTFTEPVILDLKFGQPRRFHRLSTTGYAMVMEAMHDFPVDLGCIVYVTFNEDRLVIKKDMHIISDELRQWFIEERDEKMRMIAEEIDPGLPENCSGKCSYYSLCQAM